MGGMAGGQEGGRRRARVIRTEAEPKLGLLVRFQLAGRS